MRTPGLQSHNTSLLNNLGLQQNTATKTSQVDGVKGTNNQSNAGEDARIGMGQISGRPRASSWSDRLSSLIQGTVKTAAVAAVMLAVTMGGAYAQNNNGGASLEPLHQTTMVMEKAPQSADAQWIKPQLSPEQILFKRGVQEAGNIESDIRIDASLRIPLQELAPDFLKGGKIVSAQALVLAKGEVKAEINNGELSIDFETSSVREFQKGSFVIMVKNEAGQELLIQPSAEKATWDNTGLHIAETVRNIENLEHGVASFQDLVEKGEPVHATLKEWQGKLGKARLRLESLRTEGATFYVQ